MSVASSREDDPFERFIPSVLLVAVVAAVALGLGAIRFAIPTVGATAALTAVFAASLSLAMIQFRAGHVVRSRLVLAVSITGIGAVSSLLIPGAAPAAALLPVISMLLVLPHLQRSSVPRAVIVASFCSGIVFSLGYLPHLLPTVRGLAGPAFTTAILVGVVVLVLGSLAASALKTRDLLTTMRAATDRELAIAKERLAVVAALRSVRALDTPEETALALATSLSGLPGIDLASIIETDQGNLTILSIAGREPHPVLPGARFPTPRADYLLERSAHGAWAELWEDRPIEALEDARLTALGIKGEAFAPFFVGDQIIGLVCVLTTDLEQARHLVAELPAVSEFALAAETILAPSLVARRAMARSKASLTRRIETRAFHPVFQPIIDLRTSSPVGFEGLTRFDDGARPDETFAMARRVGIGVELEEATIRAALEAADLLPPGTWLSLNVSPAFVSSGQLGTVLAEQSRPIVLEITEHEPVADYVALHEAIVALGSGVRIAVDDAGSGVANFDHIVALGADFVKIDISLVRGVDSDPTRRALILGLCHFAQILGNEVIAEGVETDGELAALRDLGVHLVQGYRVGRPAPAGGVLEGRDDLPMTSESARQA